MLKVTPNRTDELAERVLLSLCQGKMGAESTESYLATRSYRIAKEFLERKLSEQAKRQKLEAGDPSA